MGHHGALVGRERELAELRRALSDACGGQGALVMVAGEPGVGKTALAGALAAEAADRGALVLWGGAWEGGGAPAYSPWPRILRRLAAGRDLADAVAALGEQAAGRLGRLVPGLAPGHAAAEAADSDAARFQLFDAVTTLLRTAARDGPLVVVLDDLHGADHPALLLLGFLAAQVRDVPLLLVGTYREGEARLDAQLAAVLGDVARHGRRLPLRGLGERDVADMVERVAGERPGEHVARAIHQATEGNPFFVDEVVRLLSAEGRLHDAAHVAACIPDGVREAIRRRLAALPGRARALLSTASVIGRELRLGTLERVCALAPDELEGALREAVSAGVLVELPGAPGRYAFSHGLIRETLYADLGAAGRRGVHRAVALALEEVYAADPEPHLAELAHHFLVASAAGDPDKAIDYAVRAGARAMDLVAYEQAVGHFERALQADGLRDRADVPRRCDLLLALGTARSRSGDARGARETFLRAAALARGLGAPERLARAAMGYGAGPGGFEFGRVDERLVALLGEARDALGGADSALLARVLGRLATELYFSPRADERAALTAEAVAMAGRVGDTSAIASALSASYLALWGPDTTRERMRLAGDLLALGQEVRDRGLVLRGHAWRAVALMELGDWTAADLELDTHARLTAEVRDPLHLYYVPLYRATRALLDGRLADAERHAGEAFAAGQGAQSSNAAQLYATQLFAVRAEQGRLAELGPGLAEFGRRYPAAPVWRAAAAFLASSLGRRDEARRELEALTADELAGVPRDGEWLVTVALLVRVGAALRDAARTGALGALLAPYTGEAVVAGRGALCLGPVARYAGIAAATAGRTEEAIAELERALTMARRWGAEPVVAATRLDLAGVVQAGDPARAATLRADALAAARRLGLTALLERADAAQDAPPPSSPPAAPAAGRCAALYRRGDIWTLAAGGRAAQLRDAKGLHHLHRLLAAPHVELHALQLSTADARRAAGAGPAAAADGLAVRPRGAGDAGPVLDPAAKAAYRRRSADLEAEAGEAEALHDDERAARAREELAFVARELAGAVGLRGRDRRVGSDAERARVSVTRAIRAALRRIAGTDPDLGAHLDAAVRTGTFCVYAPDAGDELTWDLSGPS